MNQHNQSLRWAVILAGGDGTRLRKLTRAVAGDDRPKQFCQIIGDQTLLEQTQRRVALLFKFAQMFVVLTRTHERFYQELLKDITADRRLIQPENKGTAAAVLLSVLRIARISPKGVVAFFPSDHHFTEEGRFMSDVEMAFEQVEAEPRLITLLGVTPEHSEEQYGWIEPVKSSIKQDEQRFFRVRRFWEKPSRSVAQRLMTAGALWNTFVMVGHVKALLDIICWTLPDLYRSLSSAEELLGSRNEEQVLSDLYSHIPSTNFSTEVLSRRPGELSVLKLGNVGWTDLGEPHRVASTIQLSQAHN
jgi:mannose-1-phosphate guanylyltransferase